MKKVKETTYDLVTEYLDLRLMIDLGLEDEDSIKVGGKLIELENKMLNKTDNLHWVLNKMKESELSIKAAVDAHRDTVAKLRDKQRSILDSKERIKSLIMSIVEHTGKENTSGNLQLKTDTESYTITKAFGPVDYDEANLPEKYVKYVTQVDKKSLRKDVLSSGGSTNFASCPVTRRLTIR